MAESKPETLAPLRSLQASLRDGRLVAAVRRREHGAALNTAQRALDRYGKSVTRLEELAHVAAMVVAYLDEHGQADLRRKLTALQQQSQALAGEITTETLNNSWRQLEAINGLAHDISTQLQRGWDARIEAEFKTLAQLGRALKQMAVQEDLCGCMRDIASKGLALQKDFPPSKTSRDALKKYMQARDAALDQLSQSGSKIGPFLLRVANDQATLADLDGGTLKWLREQKALTAFAVRLSSSPKTPTG